MRRLIEDIALITEGDLRELKPEKISVFKPFGHHTLFAPWLSASAINSFGIGSPAAEAVSVRGGCMMWNDIPYPVFSMSRHFADVSIAPLEIYFQTR
jgi:hypothetical protein